MYEWVVWNPSKGAYVKLSSMLDSRGQIKKNLRYKSSAVDYSGGVCYVEAMVVSTRCPKHHNNKCMCVKNEY